MSAIPRTCSLIQPEVGKRLPAWEQNVLWFLKNLSRIHSRDILISQAFQGLLRPPIRDAGAGNETLFPVRWLEIFGLLAVVGIWLTFGAPVRHRRSMLNHLQTPAKRAM